MITKEDKAKEMV